MNLVKCVLGAAQRYLIIESFISPEEKNKIMNRLFLDCREEQWKFQPLLPSGASSSQMKRPTSAVAYKRPISQYARVAMAMGVPPQVRAEDILFLASDVSPPVVFEMEFSHDQEQDPCALHMERLMRLDSLWERPSTSKVRKPRSGCESPQRPPPRTAHTSLATSTALLPTTVFDHECQTTFYWAACAPRPQGPAANPGSPH